MFLDCPAYVGGEGSVRCGLPAEVRRRFTMRSTDGPLESATIRCPSGHWFNAPIEFLTWEGKVRLGPGNAGVSPRPRRDRRAGNPSGLDGRGGFAAPGFPENTEKDISRPNGAPAYYLGRPAWLWITAMRPRRCRTAPDQLVAASTGQPGAGDWLRPSAAPAVRGGTP
jgi:hypothetical protein